MKAGRSLSSFILIVSGFCIGNGASACTDRNDPLASPVSGVMLRFSDGQSSLVSILPPDVQPDGRLTLPGLSPPVADMPSGKFDRWGGEVAFIESDGRGGQRVCRVETWKSRTLDSVLRDRRGGQASRLVDDDGRTGIVEYRSTPRQERNPVLAKLLPHYYLSAAKAFYYDAAGNLSEIDRHMSMEINSLRNKYPLAVVAREVLYCFGYRAGKLSTAAGFDGPAVSQVPGFSCENVKQGEASFDEYKYNADGTVLSQLTFYRGRGNGAVEAPDATPRGGEGTVWLSRGGERSQRARVVISLSPAKSLTDVSTKDMDLFQSDAQSLYEERSPDGGQQLKYRFPVQPVPLTVIDDQFTTIDRYDRLRSYRHRSGLQIAEFFNANSRTPRQRQWRSLDLNRQEMFDSSGRLTRVIHYGAAPRDAYKDDLRGYAERGVLRLTPTTSGYASYRVYDYDAKGRESLVFVCWQHDAPSNKPLRHFPWWTPEPGPKRSREEALVYGMKNVANRCGRPDGTMVIQGLAQIDAYMAKTYGYDVDKLSYQGR